MPSISRHAMAADLSAPRPVQFINWRGVWQSLSALASQNWMQSCSPGSGFLRILDRTYFLDVSAGCTTLRDPPRRWALQSVTTGPGPFAEQGAIRVSLSSSLHVSYWVMIQGSEGGNPLEGVLHEQPGSFGGCYSEFWIMCLS